MSTKISFGAWLRQRRKALDLSPDDLAQRVGCAVVTLYKFESGERTPSRQIAELLAQHLNIPLEDHLTFIHFARREVGRTHFGSQRVTSFQPATNLPTPPMPLIGREQEIAAVRKRLLREDTQLLTLIGPPGIGKTRLSLAAAYEVLNEFADGVYVVWLAPISDPELVPRVITQTLGIMEIGPQSPLDRLKTYLRDKQMLLVLDNFEQILTAVPKVAELLAVCPFLKILATSRAPLRIRRERQFPVPALALPDMQHLSEPETLSDFTAVALFIERAQAVKPDFSLTRENGQLVAAICNRLDGLPLAIELISARVKLLPPSALLERLHGRLMLASDGLRDLEPRHRTLNAAIGWSFDLLNASEKMLFTRLGVFMGGWTLEAAEAVCQPDMPVIDGMASLLDKSLIQQKTGFDGEPWFAMLETIREYALERLEESGESQEIRHRHASFFLVLAETPRGTSPPAIPQAIYLSKIDQDYDNLRAGLEWCFKHDVDTGVRLALAANDYWVKRGRLMDGRFWFEKSVELYGAKATVSPENPDHLLNMGAILAYFQDDVAAMRQYALELLTRGREQQNVLNIRTGLFWLGVDALRQQDFERANALLEECLALSRYLNIDHLVASALYMLSWMTADQNDVERAWAFNTECLELSRQIGDRWLEAGPHRHLGFILEAQGRYHEAHACYVKSLRCSLELDDKRTVPEGLELLGGLASLESGEHQRAARLMGTAEALRKSIFAPVQPLYRARHDALLARVRAGLDEATFATAWAEGRVTRLEQAIEDALSE